MKKQKYPKVKDEIVYIGPNKENRGCRIKILAKNKLEIVGEVREGIWKQGEFKYSRGFRVSINIENWDYWKKYATKPVDIQKELNQARIQLHRWKNVVSDLEERLAAAVESRKERDLYWIGK